MTAKNPRPLTQPESGDPNYQKSSYQPGSLHTTDLPMQPSLAEQLGLKKTMDFTATMRAESMDSPATMATGNGGGNVTKIERGAFLDPAGVVTIGSLIQPPFDHKACILCDHVIVQQVLGNKCKMSGALCCYMRSCPEEDRKRREAASVLVVKEEIPCCGNCPLVIWHGNYGMECPPLRKRVEDEIRTSTEKTGCVFHPGARAYLNKDVIADLEARKTLAHERMNAYLDLGSDGNWQGGKEDGLKEAIALLRGDGE